MPAFLYRCPRTGMYVQGWIVDDPARYDEKAYEAIACHACGHVHLVNPKTGKVAGDRKNK
jgi:DNA-directed RNA polymerase subunit RPC12/RpoP